MLKVIHFTLTSVGLQGDPDFVHDNTDGWVGFILADGDLKIAGYWHPTLNTDIRCKTVLGGTDHDTRIQNKLYRHAISLMRKLSIDTPFTHEGIVSL